MMETENTPEVAAESGGMAVSEESGGVSVRVADENWQVSSMPEDKQYFSLDANLYEAAIVAVKARLDDKDSNIRQAWLLTEVDHWDLEKERIVLLSDNNLISIKYNFILATVEELKYIPLSHITDMMVGDFKYPSSYAYFRRGKGLKISWGRDESGFLDRWNPFSSKIPYTVFAPHLLIRRKKVTDKPHMEIDSLITEVQKAVEEYRRAHGNTSEFVVKEGELLVNSLVGLSALVHNGSNLGFNKRRGAANW